MITFSGVLKQTMNELYDDKVPLNLMQMLDEVLSMFSNCLFLVPYALVGFI